MAIFKTDLPRLLSKKDLQARAVAQQNGSTPSLENEVLEETPSVQIPEGILLYIKSSEQNAVLAIAAFELMQMFLNLLEKVQGLSSDGKSALPLQLHPHVEQDEGRMGFRLIGDEELLEKAFRLIKKIQGHLLLLKKDKASSQQIPPSWAIAYRQFFKRLKQYRQAIQLVNSVNELELFSIYSDETDDLTQALDLLKTAPRKITLNGKITGFSQNKQLIDFQVAEKDWNGIRMKKAVARPISCWATNEMLEFAKLHLDEEMEFEALMQLDETGAKQYQLQTILLKTASGIIKERIIYKGPRGGQFYLSYMGKRVYLPKAKRS